MLRNLARYAMPLCIERCISRWSAGVSWWPSCSSLAMVSNSISRGVMIILAGWLAGWLAVMYGHYIVSSTGCYRICPVILSTNGLNARQYACSLAINRASFRSNVSHLIPFGFGNVSG